MAAKPWAKEKKSSGTRRVDAVDKDQLIARLEAEVVERKRAEETLRGRERMNSLLFEKAPAMMQLSRFDDGTMVRVNEQTVKTYGFARDELIGKKTSELGINRDFEGREAVLAELQQKGSVHDVEMTLYTKSGEKIFVSNNLDVVELDGEKYLLSVSYDITERKRAEEALRESEQRYSSLFANKINGMAHCRVITDEQGKPVDHVILRVNEAYERIVGLKKADIEGRLATEVFPDIKSYALDFIGIYGRVALEGVEARFEQDLKPENKYLSTYVYSPKHGEFTVIFTDITKQKRAEEALSEAKMRAELYLDLMGHDINNMHQIALGYLELAQDGPPGVQQNDMIGRSIEVLERSTQLIRNVRKLQKLNGGLPGMYEVDVAGVLFAVQHEFGSVPGKSVTLNLNGNGHSFVRANELLPDVFANLVGNAIKHTGDKADIAMNMDIVAENGRRYCRVGVEDNGPGIPDDFKDAIFNRMLKGTSKAKGMGLGLYLVKSLVESYGGRVWAEDRVIGDHTQGARFVVLLPAIEK